MARSLRDCLADYPRVLLEAIAEGWHVPLTDEQLPEVVERLAAELTRREEVGRIVGLLNPQEREALGAVAAREQTRSFVLIRQYGDIRRLGPGRLEWEAAWREPSSPLERLWFLGLVHREYGVDGDYHGEVLFVPSDLRQLLPPLPMQVAEFQVDEVPNPSRMVDQGDALARDVFVVLSHVRNHRVRVAKGGLPASELKRILPRLQSSAPAQRLLLLQRLCTVSGLLEEEERHWKAASTAAEWLRDGSLLRQRTLFQNWMRDPDWDELCQVPTLRCETTGWRSDPTAARRTLVRFLGQCPVGAWLDPASLVKSIYQLDPDFARPDGDYASWYIRDASTGQYLAGFGNWDRVEGAWLRYLLEGPLFWLGITALGFGPAADRPHCIRLTSKGAGILGQVDLPEEAPRPMVVLASLDVRAPWTASWYDRFLLERLAQWKGEDAQDVRYTLDREALRRAADEGVQANQVHGFLRRVTGGRLPDKVTEAVRAWMAPSSAEVKPG